MRLRKQRTDPKKRLALPGLGVLVAVGIVVAVTVLLRKRGSEIKGAALDATEGVRKHGSEYDDAALAHKVESEIFRDSDAPKGDVVVNGNDGVIELRGKVDTPEQVEALGKAAQNVTGVTGVNNLLHVTSAS